MTKYKGLLILTLAGLLATGLIVTLAHHAAQAQSPPPPGSSGMPFSGNAVQMGSDHFGLDWNVAAGGGNTMSSDHFRIQSTSGQPWTGWLKDTHFGAHVGYWQTFTYRVYLPLVLRNYS